MLAESMKELQTRSTNECSFRQRLKAPISPISTHPCIAFFTLNCTFCIDPQQRPRLTTTMSAWSVLSRKLCWQLASPGAGLKSWAIIPAGADVSVQIHACSQKKMHTLLARVAAAHGMNSRRCWPGENCFQKAVACVGRPI